MKGIRGKFYNEHRRAAGTITMAISENTDKESLVDWLHQESKDPCHDSVVVFFEKGKFDLECLVLYREIQQAFPDAIVKAIFDVPHSEMVEIIKSTNTINKWR